MSLGCAKRAAERNSAKSLTRDRTTGAGRLDPVWVCLIMALAACSPLPIPGASAELYAVNDVRVRAASRTENGSVRIEYRVLAETLYYCGGAQVRRSGDDAYVSLVRVPVGAEYEGESIGIQMEDDGWFSIVIPNVSGVLLIDDGSTTKELLPREFELP